MPRRIIVGAENVSELNNTEIKSLRGYPEIINIPTIPRVGVPLEKRIFQSDRCRKILRTTALKNHITSFCLTRVMFGAWGTRRG